MKLGQPEPVHKIYSYGSFLNMQGADDCVWMHAVCVLCVFLMY